MGQHGLSNKNSKPVHSQKENTSLRDVTEIKGWLETSIYTASNNLGELVRKFSPRTKTTTSQCLR